VLLSAVTSDTGVVAAYPGDRRAADGPPDRGRGRRAPSHLRRPQARCAIIHLSSSIACEPVGVEIAERTLRTVAFACAIGSLS